MYHRTDIGWSRQNVFCIIDNTYVRDLLLRVILLPRRYMKSAATCLGNLRRRDQASLNARKVLLDALITAQTETLGATHGDTLKSQVDLALLLSEVGT